MGQKNALTLASKTAHCLLAESIRQPHHKNTHTLTQQKREKRFSTETVITNAKSSGAKGQTVCDKGTINRTKILRGRSGLVEGGYASERFSRGKQA